MSGNTVWSKNVKEGLGLIDRIKSDNPIDSGNRDTSISQSTTNSNIDGKLPPNVDGKLPPNVDGNQPPNVDGNQPPNVDEKGVKDAVSNYGNDVEINNNVDEIILKNGHDPSKIRNILKIFDLSGNLSLSSIIDSKIKEIKEIIKQFDPNKAKVLYDNAMNSIIKIFDNLIDSISNKISSWFYDSFESPQAKKDMKILSSHILQWITIPMTYVVVMNWWYVLCYTNFKIDFRDYIFIPLHWIVAPPLHSLEFVNYYMLSMRMDANTPVPRSFMRDLWHWRPITFTVFHLIILTIISTAPLTDTISTIVLNGGPLFGILIAMSIFFYFSLYVTEKWYEKFLPIGIFGILLLIGMSLISFLLMFAFIAALCPILAMYFVFISYMAIFAFNMFWPPSVLSIVNQIFQELKESPLVNDKPMNTFEKLQNVLFQQFHSIYLLIIVITIFGIHMSQIKNINNNSLKAFIILVNVLICMLFVPSASKLVVDIFTIITDGSSANNTVTPPEQPIYTVRNPITP